MELVAENIAVEKQPEHICSKEGHCLEGVHCMEMLHVKPSAVVQFGHIVVQVCRLPEHKHWLQKKVGLGIESSEVHWTEGSSLEEEPILSVVEVV